MKTAVAAAEAAITVVQEKWQT